MGKSQATARSQGLRRRGARATALRRPPEKGLPLLKHRIRLKWESGLEAWKIWTPVFCVIAIYSLLSPELIETPSVPAGSIAARNYVADRDLSVVNEKATEELRKKAEAAEAPVYDLDSDLEAESPRRVGDLFAAGQEILQGQTGEEPESETAAAVDGTEVEMAPDLLQILKEASGLKITPEAADWLREKGFPGELKDRLAGELRRILRRRVVSDRALVLEHLTTGIVVYDLSGGHEQRQLDLFRYLDYPDEVREEVEEEIRNWAGLEAYERALLANFVLANVAPNLTYNSDKTLTRRQAAAKAAATVSYSKKKGEVIVRKGELVDEVTARTIAQLVGARDRSHIWLTVTGNLLLLAAILAFLWLRTGLENRRDRSRARLFNECLILLGFHLLGLRFSYFVADAISGAVQTSSWSSLTSYTYAIPFTSLAFLAVLLYGRNMAFALALASAFLVGRMAGGESMWTMTTYSLMSSLAAVFALDQILFRQRAVMIRVAWVIGLANTAGVVMLRALTGETAGGFPQVAFDLVCAFAGAFLAAAITSFAVPIFEAIFAITTYIKLLELSNTNLPLLRRLALEAPGTFQHSIAVANLAKTGCEAIGLDSILVHTSALYHDIGKVYRPQYFVENQVPGQNPHDKIQPTMSALILINHVKEGLELATKEGLPQPISDAIEQHHGTQLIRFFYNRARERCDPETDDVGEDEFRYPGPKPQSKEMGILMLADGVEAASRTLVEASRQKIRGLLRKLFDNALQDHQLDQTDLTLGDLGRVEEAFLNVLTKIYHRRIDYPGFDFNQPQSSKKKRRLTGELKATRAEKDLPRDPRTVPAETLSAETLPAETLSAETLSAELSERKES